MCRSFWIDGNATFTTVLSSMIMNRPTATAASVHHFRFSGVKRRAFTPGRLEKPRHSARTVTRTLRPVSEFAWTPSPEQVESANLTRLAGRLGVKGYRELHRVSIEEPERFWPALIEDLGLEFSTPWERVLDESDGPEWARWFVGGRLNLARSCVHGWVERTPSAPAAVFLGED